MKRFLNYIILLFPCLSFADPIPLSVDHSYSQSVAISEEESALEKEERIVENVDKSKALTPKIQTSSPPSNQSVYDVKLTRDWGGYRSSLENRGVFIISNLAGNGTWNLHGGKKTTLQGMYEYLFDLRVKIESEPSFHYRGGTLLADFASHHGQRPSKNVGVFIPIDPMEAPPFDELYALWYKQVFGENRFWFLIGKSDAYDNFTTLVSASFFFNTGFTTLPTILYLPTYPNPAMSIVASLRFADWVSVTGGVFDGSLAEGIPTGKRGVFGHFFKHLPSHAFLIGELNVKWNFYSTYKGRLGVGGWHHTGTFSRFSGGKQKGTGGPYLTLDQKISKKGNLFLITGMANPEVNSVQYYLGTGLTWQNVWTHDVLGAGMSLANFSKKTHFTKSCETAYEIFYQWQFSSWGFFEPDFQYIVHPGGRGLPNASVFSLWLQLNL